MSGTSPEGAEERELQRRLDDAYRRSRYSVSAQEADFLGVSSPSEADPDVVLLEAQIKAHRLRHPAVPSPSPAAGALAHLAHLAVWALFLTAATGTVAGFVLWLCFVALDAATLMMGS